MQGVHHYITSPLETTDTQLQPPAPHLGKSPRSFPFPSDPPKLPPWLSPQSLQLRVCWILLQITNSIDDGIPMRDIQRLTWPSRKLDGLRCGSQCVPLHGVLFQGGRIRDKRRVFFFFPPFLISFISFLNFTVVVLLVVREGGIWGEEWLVLEGDAMLQALVKLHGAPAAAAVGAALVRRGCCVKEPVHLVKRKRNSASLWPPFRANSTSTSTSISIAATSVASHEVEGVDGEGSLDFKGTVPEGIGKTRLDAWLAGQLPLVSRARVQSNIRQGLILVNGKAITKGSYVVRQGDVVECELMGWAPLDANPEDIPLDIVYEDKHVIVINKPAHMVVHPAPGHAGGTLVNALLHHCGLPAMRYSSGSAPRIALETPSDVVDGSEEPGEDTDEEALGGILTTWSGPAPVIRPGIVHRLDKGTSGLLVVAKDEYTHGHLCDQFKARSVRRSYVSLTCGVPSLTSGRVEIPIGRDPRDRKKMAAIPVSGGSSRSRTAASRFRVLEVLANGGSALVEWRLETGRTHQIRVHAQYLGYPLLGDDTYGGTQGAALSQLSPKTPTANHGSLRKLISGLQRPCLHAITLGFQHPRTLEELNFKCAPPQDFEDTWRTLRHI